jgi:hypothetical protein
MALLSRLFRSALTRLSRRASPAAQALRSDVVRRAASRGGTLRCAEAIALPTVMSISPTRLIDDPNMMQSRGGFKTALLPYSVHKTCCLR